VAPQARWYENPIAVGEFAFGVAPVDGTTIVILSRKQLLVQFAHDALESRSQNPFSRALAIGPLLLWAGLVSSSRIIPGGAISPCSLR